MKNFLQILKRNRKYQDWICILIYLDQSIRINMICMSMREIYCIKHIEFLRIKYDFTCSFHKISDNIIWEPRIHKNRNIFISWILYSYEEFRMSKRRNNHSMKINSPSFRGILLSDFSSRWKEPLYCFGKFSFLCWYHTTSGWENNWS